MKQLTASVGVTVLVLLGHSASAHHSFAMFDRSKTVSITGTVRAFEWTNPHLWLWINTVDEQGKIVAWAFEGVAPGEATRLNGWSKDTFKKGEKLTVEAAPLKDGRNGGSLGKITRADGTVVGRSGNAPGPGGPPGAGGPPGGGPPSAPPTAPGGGGY
jgi:hypothetical protein